MATSSNNFDDDPQDNIYAIDKKRSRQEPSTSKQIQRVWHRRTAPSVDAYTRHKQLINNYLLFHQGATKCLVRDDSRDKNDFDVIRENHRFLWDNTDDSDLTWEAKLAKRYYDKLFKEYCIADLTRYKDNKVAMRWRIEKEVRSGKGQFVCGNKYCSIEKGLDSWEVNFAYKEDGIRKNALVKLRLCPQCSAKLNYHSQKRKAQRKPQSKKQRKRRCSDSDDESSSVPLKRPIKEEPKDEEDQSQLDVAEKTKEDKKEEPDSIWSKPRVIIDEEAAREEALNDFLDDLLF
ncbi:hypothetical protein QR680_001216 [Steinernema hermaphroditum]|uniref:Protein FRA10AC1 homolog n=1 Tax=Steinernema hermaphroditum TaxID=289476 RepID=A0AA39GZB6_9BILA|nr:hypothetical protein QR680_001216 [Steinernema hermaphroditum]